MATATPQNITSNFFIVSSFLSFSYNYYTIFQTVLSHRLAKGLQLNPDPELGAKDVRALLGSRVPEDALLPTGAPTVGLDFAESEMR
jgi:hypothetical protein